MKTTVVPHALILAFLLPLSLLAKSAELETKIIVESQVTSRNPFNKPAYLLYPEGESKARLLAAGIDSILREALEGKGYLIVDSEEDAAVFVKVDMLQPPAFEANVEVSGKPRIDYSNSPSTRNYAATAFGGRYSALSNPERIQSTNTVGLMLGPSGEIIDIAEQKPREAKITPGESQEMRVLLHPLLFQIEAWMFDEKDADAPPASLWKVTCTYENPKDEAFEPQMQDVAEAAAKQIGKNLKKPKLVTRKSKD